MLKEETKWTVKADFQHDEYINKMLLIIIAQMILNCIFADHIWGNVEVYNY